MPPTSKLRIFLDSNVIFSALYSPVGAPHAILERFFEGEWSLLVSHQVLEEVVRTLKAKRPAGLPVLKRLLVSMPPEIQRDPAPEEIIHWAELIHKDDAAILAAAVAAQPDYLVTGDRHFLGDPSIAEKSGLRIVTPDQLLKLLGV